MEVLLVIGFIVIVGGLAIRMISTSNNKTTVAVADPTPVATVQEIADAAETTPVPVVEAAPAKKTRAPAKAKAPVTAKKAAVPKVPRPRTPKSKKSV
jgi:hypothetical protein